MRCRYSPVLVQQSCSALVQVGGGAPLAQGDLPGPTSEGGVGSSDDSGLGEHAATADCEREGRRTLNNGKDHG